MSNITKILNTNNTMHSCRYIKEKPLRNGNLCGCIGNILPVMPLYRSVMINTVSSSSGDSRFPAMKPEELEDMEVEDTVISPLEPLKDIKDITIGRHGLYITNNKQTGILLPQVAVEQNWDVHAFL